MLSLLVDKVFCYCNGQLADMGCSCLQVRYLKSFQGNCTNECLENVLEIGGFRTYVEDVVVDNQNGDC